MTGRSPERGRLRQEQGASLLLVVIFVMVFGLITGVILDFANTGFKATEQTTKIRDNQQAVESAMESAINAARGSSSQGYSSFPCQSHTYDEADLVTKETVEVRCVAHGQSVGGNATDVLPSYAVLALGNGAGEGFRVVGGGGLAVAGGIHSNGTIDPGAADLRVFGDASAGSCPLSDRLLVTGLASCGDQQDDPGYPSAASSTTGMPVPKPPVGCAGGVATFNPGLYTERIYDPQPGTAYLSATCPIWYLRPGNYYFDLPDGEDVVVPSGVTLVGGTRSGSTCLERQPGVQLIFGGETRLVVNGSLEACAGPDQGGSATSQQIVLYGLTTGDRCPCSTVAPLTPSVPVAAATFANPGAVVSEDGNVAAADLSGGTAKVASLGDLSSGGQPPRPFFDGLPPGTTVGRVMIDVRHREAGPFGVKLRPTLTVKVGARQHVFDPASRPALPNRTGMATDSFDVTDLVRDQFGYLDVNSLEVEYAVDGADLARTTCDRTVVPGCDPPETAQAQVDAITLRVEQTPPGFEAHRCAGGGLACSILDNTGSGPGDKLVLRGTVVTPSAGVDLAARSGLTRLERGVVARRVSVTPQGDIGAEHPVLSVPMFTGALAPPTGRVVELTASVHGRDRLRAQVLYDDASGLPGTKVTVLSWSWL